MTDTIVEHLMTDNQRPLPDLPTSIRTTPAPRDINGFRRTAMGLAHTQPAVLAAGLLTQTVAHPTMADTIVDYVVTYGTCPCRGLPASIGTEGSAADPGPPS